MKLYNVPETSAVGKLVNKLETACSQKNLTLSRWQANGGGHSTTISYAAHTDKRYSQYRRQPDETVMASEILSKLEGTTEKCEAYRKLSRMLADVEAL